VQQYVLHRYPFNHDVVQPTVRADTPVAPVLTVLPMVIRTPVGFFSALFHFVSGSGIPDDEDHFRAKGCRQPLSRSPMAFRAGKN